MDLLSPFASIFSFLLLLRRLPALLYSSFRAPFCILAKFIFYAHYFAQSVELLASAVREARPMNYKHLYPVTLIFTKLMPRVSMASVR